MKLCAVVIWYNPDEKCVKNISSYLNFCSRVYVVDNSVVNNAGLLNGVDKIDYISLGDNKGIAYAQNIGCDKALSEGFSWCMTMDQDSFWKKEELEKYLSIVEKYVDTKTVYSFGPNHDTPKVRCYYQEFKNWVKKIINYHQNLPVAQQLEVENTDILIASGNIISLPKWKEAGCFDEKLFIDEVDHEFCLRLGAKFGNCILKINTVYLNHMLGDPKDTLFTRIDFHSGVRLYYCVRNCLYVCKQYPEYNIKYHRIGSYKELLWENIRDFRFKDVNYMLKGFWAYKNNITGKYTGR